jgi:uncharacterized membrane protein HdeD (DUF308 family)
MVDEAIGSAARKIGGSVIIWGLLVIFAGILCVMSPMVTTVGVILLLAVGLAIAGLSALTAAFKDPGAGRKLLDIVLGLFSLLAAILLLANPFAGALGLGTLLAILLLARGLAGIMLGFQAPAGRIWILLAAAIDLTLAYLLYSLGSLVAAATIGLLVGLSMIVWGIRIIVAGGAVRSLAS